MRASPPLTRSVVALAVALGSGVLIVGLRVKKGGCSLAGGWGNGTVGWVGKRHRARSSRGRKTRKPPRKGGWAHEKDRRALVDEYYEEVGGDGHGGTVKQNLRRMQPSSHDRSVQMDLLVVQHSTKFGDGVSRLTTRDPQVSTQVVPKLGIGEIEQLGQQPVLRTAKRTGGLIVEPT